MNAILEQYGLTRGKLVAIAGLLSLLVGVWGNALLGSGTKGPSQANRATSEPPPAQQPQASQQPSTPATPNESATASEPIVLLPADVKSVAASDPFAAPAWARDSNSPTDSPVVSLSEREAMLEQLRSEGVSIVMLSGDEKIAQVGERRVRPNDVLAGYRVLDITPAGVVLSPDPVDDSPL